MTTAEKLIRAKQDLDKVYEAGCEKGKAEGGAVEFEDVSLMVLDEAEKIDFVTNNEGEGYSVSDKEISFTGGTLTVKLTGYVEFSLNMNTSGHKIVVDGITVSKTDYGSETVDFAGEVTEGIVINGNLFTGTFSNFVIRKDYDKGYTDGFEAGKAEGGSAEYVYEDVSLTELQNNGQLTVTDYAFTENHNISEKSIEAETSAVVISISGYVEFELTINGNEYSYISIDNDVVYNPEQSYEDCKYAFKGNVNESIVFYVELGTVTFDRFVVRVEKNYDKGYADGQASMVDESKIIKKTASGNPLYVDDVSEVPHEVSVQLTSDTVTDFSDVEVCVYGKNLCDNVWESGGIDINTGENYSTSGTLRMTNYAPLKPDTIYTITKNNFTENILTRFYDKNKNYVGHNSAINTATSTFTTSDNHYYVRFVINGFVDSTTKPKIQIAVGTDSKYEEYKEPQIVTANVDGTVTGIKSLSPIMTLMSSDDVNISMTYHKSWGMQTEYNRFWDSYQNNGNRDNYAFGFASEGWKEDTFKPKYPIIPIRMNHCFAYWGQQSDGRLIDLRKACVLDTSKCTNLANCFTSNRVVSAIGVFNTRLSTIEGLFNGAEVLETVELLILKNDGSQVFTNTFKYCRKLSEIRIEGVIGQNDFNVQWSTKLTAASLLSILTALSKDSTVASGKSITFATASEAVIEADAKCTEQYNLALAAGWEIKFA